MWSSIICGLRKMGCSRDLITFSSPGSFQALHLAHTRFSLFPSTCTRIIGFMCCLPAKNFPCSKSYLLWRQGVLTRTIKSQPQDWDKRWQTACEDVRTFSKLDSPRLFVVLRANHVAVFLSKRESGLASISVSKLVGQIWAEKLVLFFNITAILAGVSLIKVLCA